MVKKDIDPRIAGWALTLEDYDYIIEHRAGTKMKHVDALSRSPLIMMIEDDFLMQVRKAQSNDEQIQLIIKLLSYGSHEQFLMHGGILYNQDEHGEKLIYIPKVMQFEIIRKVHETGHFATSKMVEVIKRSYYIPKLKEKCDRFRQNCVTCILSATKGGKQEGYLHSIPKGDCPLSVYHLDHLGPLASTSKKYQYIFSVVDGFSKFVWIYPVKSTTVAEVILKLDLQKSVFGNPTQMITDRGPCFTSNIFKDYCQENSVSHIMTVTGVPRGNGQIERINGIIVSSLSKLSNENPQDWYKFTSNLQRFINGTWQRTIRMTPFEAMFGVKMRNAEDVELARIVEEEILNHFIVDRDDQRLKVRENIENAQEEQRRSFNKKRKPAVPYKVGDLVAIRRTQFGSSLKFCSKYLGPYQVLEVLSNDRYRVQKVGEHLGPKQTSTCADYMKRWANEISTFVESSSDDEN